MVASNIKSGVEIFGVTGNLISLDGLTIKSVSLDIHTWVDTYGAWSVNAKRSSYSGLPYYWIYGQNGQHIKVKLPSDITVPLSMTIYYQRGAYESDTNYPLYDMPYGSYTQYPSANIYNGSFTIDTTGLNFSGYTTHKNNVLLYRPKYNNGSSFYGTRDGGGSLTLDQAKTLDGIYFGFSNYKYSGYLFGITLYYI